MAFNIPFLRGNTKGRDHIHWRIGSGAVAPDYSLADFMKLSWRVKSWKLSGKMAYHFDYHTMNQVVPGTIGIKWTYTGTMTLTDMPVQMYSRGAPALLGDIAVDLSQNCVPMTEERQIMDFANPKLEPVLTLPDDYYPSKGNFGLWIPGWGQGNFSKQNLGHYVRASGASTPYGVFSSQSTDLGGAPVTSATVEIIDFNLSFLGFQFSSVPITLGHEEDVGMGASASLFDSPLIMDIAAAVTLKDKGIMTAIDGGNSAWENYFQTLVGNICWLYDYHLTGSPAAQHLQTNNNDPTAVTQLYLSTTGQSTITGHPIGIGFGFLDMMNVNPLTTQILLEDFLDAKNALYQLTGPITYNSDQTVFIVPVSYIAGSATAPVTPYGSPCAPNAVPDGLGGCTDVPSSRAWLSDIQLDVFGFPPENVFATVISSGAGSVKGALAVLGKTYDLLDIPPSGSDLQIKPTITLASFVLTPSEWWPFQNQSGEAVYNTETGDQIADPFG